MFSIFVCLFRLSAVVHSEIFWGLAERRWTQEPDWQTSIRWPSTDRWVVTSMSWWVKVIPALSSSLRHHPSSPLLLRWALTASEVCGVTSQLWRRWSSSRFSTPKSSTTSRSSRPGLYIMYISSLFYTLLDQYQELSIKHHQFIDVWGQYFYCFYFVIVKDNY